MLKILYINTIYLKKMELCVIIYKVVPHAVPNKIKGKNDAEKNTERYGGAGDVSCAGDCYADD